MTACHRGDYVKTQAKTAILDIYIYIFFFSHILVHIEVGSWGIATGAGDSRCQDGN